MKNNKTELNISKNKNGKYKLEIIQNSAVYTKKSKLDHLLGFYYLIFQKNYLKKISTSQPQPFSILKSLPD